MLKLILKSNSPITLTKKKLSLKIARKLQFKNILLKELDYLKPKRKILTVLKSPHVHKKSREQFALKTFKKMFIIDNQNFISLLYVLIFFKKSLYPSENFISKIIL